MPKRQRKTKATSAYQPAVSLPELCEQYGSDDKCRAYLQALRWPKGVICPRCGHTSVSTLKTRQQFDCDKCRYQFSVTAGTIFHDSHLPLYKWFLALYLMAESRNGISANQMKRTLKVSYKTAWYLCHRIREALKDESQHDRRALLREIVEVDETWVGGRRRFVGRGRRDHKTMVLGAIQRGGKVRLKVDKRADRKTLHKFINDHVHDNAEAIMTDEWAPYKGIGDGNTRHETVNHKDEEWVRGEAHTNTVEGVFSLFKRSVVGAFHQVSAKHLDRYLDEFEFRFNNRTNRYFFRDALMKLLASSNLPYGKLVA